MFQFGRVLKIFKPGAKDVFSSDFNVHALLEMWDDVRLTALVHAGIAEKLKQGDFVVTEIVPISQNIFRHVTVKVIRGKQGEETWREYKGFLEKKQKGQEKAPQSINLDIPRNGMIR